MHVSDVTQDTGWGGWGGGGDVMTFLARAHMRDATQHCFCSSYMHLLPMLRKTWVGVGWVGWVGWGWGCDDVPCTSTHVRCYASMWWVYLFYLFYILSPKAWYH